MLVVHLLFEVDDQELVNEGDVVAGMVAVPDCQKDESSGLTQESIVQESKSFVDVGHDPRVRVDVEAVDQLKNKQKGFDKKIVKLF